METAVTGTAFVHQLGTVVMGIAFGMLFMNTPLAIVLYLLLPTVWAIMTEFIGALGTARRWLDQTVTLTPLTAGEMIGEAWAKVAATTAVWVVLPLAVGLVRLMRREVS